MNKKILGIALVLLVIFAVGAIYAQVCVISTVQITGFETKVVTFTNNSEKAEKVRVEVKWKNPEGSREWEQPVPGGTKTKSGKFTPGTVTWTAPGTIYSIKECF
jgi:hypothetical protein